MRKQRLENLFDLTSERIDVLHVDEVQAIKNTMLSELEVEDLMLKCNLADTEFQEHETNRIEFTETHRIKLNQDEISRKTFLVNKTKECKECRDNVQTELDAAKGIFRNRKSEEKAIADKLGKRRVVKNHVERVVFKKYLIACSVCYGGDLEGKSYRRLMENGVEIFNQVRDYLVSELRKENIGNGILDVTIEEIVEFVIPKGKLLIV